MPGTRDRVLPGHRLRTMATYSRVRASGFVEWLAVPALDDLGARDAEPEHEPTAAEMVQGHGGHRHRRRRAGRELAERGAEAHPAGLALPTRPAA